jgi:hypothetical protein
MNAEFLSKAAEAETTPPFMAMHVQATEIISIIKNSVLLVVAIFQSPSSAPFPQQICHFFWQLL